MRITAQALYNITKCAHRVYLDANGDPKDRSEVGSFVKLLWELGLQTEREYLDTLGELTVSDLSWRNYHTRATNPLHLSGRRFERHSGFRQKSPHETSSCNPYWRRG